METYDRSLVHTEMHCVQICHDCKIWIQTKLEFVTLSAKANEK